MIQNVDFSIAKYTSLVDDFLMNHKPSIIYEEVPFVKILLIMINQLLLKVRKI